MLRFFLTILALSSFICAQEKNIPLSVVTDIDLLMTRQSCGETRRNLSVTGKPLKISGTIYSEGIGTHATSMIPISTGNEGMVLTGACGMDDNADEGGSVEFSIMSGTEILWKSIFMQKNVPAQKFEIKMPPGTKKLYLLARSMNDSKDSYVNWVDLKWHPADKITKKEAHHGPVTINVQDFGMIPHVREDQSPALRRALTEARKYPAAILEIPEGSYHFFQKGALPLSFHISNHDQPSLHHVCVPLVDLRNVVIKGNNSLFLFHDLVLPLLVMDSSGITIENLSIDYERPYYSEAVITAVQDDSIDVKIDKDQYPYEVEGENVAFHGEGWKNGISSAIIFQKDTGYILENTGDYVGTPSVTRKENSVLQFDWKLKEKGAKPGDIITLRTWGRPHPGCCIYRSTDTRLINVPIHSSTGMALVAQRSGNIHIDGGGSFPRPETGRAYSAGADATHFSNTEGLIIVENGLYKGMMDDAINVHSTSLSIEEITAPDTFRATYRHGQSVGFEVFLPGEPLRFIAGPTLEEGKIATVSNVRKLSTTEVLITLESPIPGNVKPGDAVENARYQPEVVFRGNTVTGNRARGSLFTTPHKVLVEKNHFDHSSGSAILLAGDAQGWYESGACHEVIIRENVFTNNLTSRYQFTNALISIYPEVRQLDGQKQYYHHNVLIENNIFRTFDVPILFAISTKGIVFRNNIIEYNNDFKGWGQKSFQFKRCAGILFKNNSITPEHKWSLEDCQLESTSPEEILFH